MTNRLLLLPLLASLALLPVPASGADGTVWSAGQIDLPLLDSGQRDILRAIEKTAHRAPIWKKGVVADVLITASDGGSRATVVESNIDEAKLPEFETWISKWILPVGEPGMAVPVQVRWVKPDKGEKKEKVPKGGTPTKPPPGLRYDVGFAVSIDGPVTAEEVLRAERLVFTAGDGFCPDEVATLPRPGWGTTLWHLDIAVDGAITATPQDVYVPPPDPTTKEGKKALEAAGEGAGEAGVEAPEMPEAPKPEAPKFELPGGLKAPEAPEAPEAGAPEEEAVEPPREWTPMELCVAPHLAEARVRLPDKAGITRVDGFPVVVRRP